MNQLFVVGAQRCGTTYLHRLLDAHPQVRMARPVRPEPKFFLDCERVAQGRDAYEAQYFPDVAGPVTYLGEKCTSYIERPDAGALIHGFYPDARILAILREPVSRAVSNYRFSVENGLEPLPFDEALAAEEERLRSDVFSTSANPFAYRTRGHYVEYLAPYVDLFGRDRVRVLVFEELVGNVAALGDLYRWLGVDDSFVPGDVHRAVNASSEPAPPPSTALRELAAGFGPSVQRLEDFLGRSLDVWRARWAEY
jgi:hypothetical protein